jgi:DNA-directed RNA polymerase subunit RPC12/RpoP
MSDEILIELVCPSCTHPIDLKEQSQQIVCPACSSHLLLEGHVCPACAQYHKETTGFCRACGTAMMRTCQRCGVSNWSGAEYCQDCGAALDIFQLLHLHNKQSTMNRLDGQMREAQAFKEKERADSDRRMATLLENEHERVRAIHARRETLQMQDRQLMMTAVFVLSIFILIVAAFAVL